MMSVSTGAADKGQQLSIYIIFCLKCIAIFFLLNGSHYLTKYIEDSDKTYYDEYHIDRIRDFQCFVAWFLFTALWNIILSYNVNISNNKSKYKQIINDTSSESNYISKIQLLKNNRCNLFRWWHICIIVLIHDCIAYICLQYLNPNYLIFEPDLNSNFCLTKFQCSKLSIDDLCHDVFGFVYVFLASSISLSLFDAMFCRRLQRNYLKLYKPKSENSLSTPLVSLSSTPGGSDIDMMSLTNIKEIIHIERHHIQAGDKNGQNVQNNKSGSPLVWSTIPTEQDKRSRTISRTRDNTFGTARTGTLTGTTIGNPTPIPSSYKNISYLGDSNSINGSCVNVWCLNVFQSIMFLLFFSGIEFVSHWQKSLLDSHFEQWTLALLVYTFIWRYIMTRMGRLYDGLRIFSFTDHNSELNTMISSQEVKSNKEQQDNLYDDTDEEKKEKVDDGDDDEKGNNDPNKKQERNNQSLFSTTQYFMSMELILFTFVMSIYYIMLRIYLVYVEPSWSSFALSLMFHIGSELIENGIRTSMFYYNLTNNLYFLLADRHKADICMGRIIGCFKDESKLRLWRDRFAIDISIKMIISFLSCLAAVLLNISEYFGYLTIDNPKFTAHQCGMSALRVAITALAELILYVSMYLLWYDGKGFLIEPFTRIIKIVWDKNKFVWLFMATFVTAGLTYGGKNI